MMNSNSTIPDNAVFKKKQDPKKDRNLDFMST